MNIFVGNLLFEATEADVKKLFGDFGSVASVVIVMDKKGRNSRGFGFVEMPDYRQAQAAIAALHNKDFMGRPLNVEVARPKPEAGPEGIKRTTVRPQINTGVNRHKQGRRSLSFIKRRAAEGIEEPIIKRKVHDNPMRWRKKPKPWQKAKGAPKPWEKTEGAPAQAKPWRKNTARAQHAGSKHRGKSNGFKRQG